VVVAVGIVLLPVAPASAQELLANRSFESPVTTANGNNFFATIPTWTVTPDTVQPQPSNIVRAWAGYTGNPTVTPTGGGAQYFDVNSTSGTIRQTVTIATSGMIAFSAWFSVRDNQQALSGLVVNIRNSANVVVASASTSFVVADPIGLWKQASAANIPVAAGTYTFEIVLPDPANVDLASMVFTSPLAISKTSNAYSDPLNGVANPKLIPGGVVEYMIGVTNSATYTVTSNTIVIADPTPANSDLVVTDIGGAGSGPAAFAAGASGLTYSFIALGSIADDIEFSNDSGATWTYVPVANASGVDTNVTNVRLRPKGAMAASSSASFRLRYRVR